MSGGLKLNEVFDNQPSTGPRTFEAVIPRQPAGLRVVTDRSGDVWQHVEMSTWRCTRAKIGGLFGGSNETHWGHLVYAFGPLTAIQYTDAGT